MVCNAVYRRAFGTHLRPSRSAMLANSAAEVMVHHDSRANLREARVNSGSNLSDNPAWFVASYRRSPDCKAQRILRPHRAIHVQVRTAHTRRFHRYHDLTKAR